MLCLRHSVARKKILVAIKERFYIYFNDNYLDRFSHFSVNL